MLNAKDLDIQSEVFKCMVVGKNGSGKSIFASSFPTPGFIFDFDKGIKSYRGKDFDYEQFDMSGKGWSDFEKLFIKVTKNDKYKTIILDSTTSMSDCAMERAMQLDPKRSPTGGPIWNVHYGMTKNLVVGYINRFLNLPLKVNFVLISHVETSKDDVTGQIFAGPLLIGNLTAKVPTMFDEVYYSTVQKEGTNLKYMLQTVNIGLYHASSRLSGKNKLLPDYIPNNYNAIMNYLKKEKVLKKP